LFEIVFVRKISHANRIYKKIQELRRGKKKKKKKKNGTCRKH